MVRKHSTGPWRMSFLLLPMISEAEPGNCWLHIQKDAFYLSMSDQDELVNQLSQKELHKDNTGQVQNRFDPTWLKALRRSRA